MRSGQHHDFRLDEVAQKAGVSVPTVSRVFNNVKVGEASREKVMKALRALEVAKPKSAMLVGLLLPDLGNEFFRELFRSLDDAFGDNASLYATSSARRADRENQRLAGLISLPVEGLVVVPTGESSPETLAIQLRDKVSVPTVVFDHRCERDLERQIRDRYGSLPIDFVTSDSRRGTQQAIDFLHEQGHVRIGYVSGPPTVDTAKDRLSAFRQALATVRLEFDPSLLFEGRYSRDSGTLAGRWFLGKTPKERPTAVLLANDVMALGFIRAVVEEGVRVPEDVAVVGFDDIEGATNAEPPLATISQQLPRLAIAVREALLERVGHVYSGPPRENRIDTEFTPRRSASRSAPS